MVSDRSDCFDGYSVSVVYIDICQNNGRFISDDGIIRSFSDSRIIDCDDDDDDDERLFETKDFGVAVEGIRYIKKHHIRNHIRETPERQARTTNSDSPSLLLNLQPAIGFCFSGP